ncbi:MAG: FAD-binding oxidoreductase [Alphaproteobacteria bacterium]|nr:FAD-binding oxidoreductase [Alphaproteobacteria bacterium]
MWCGQRGASSSRRIVSHEPTPDGLTPPFHAPPRAGPALEVDLLIVGAGVAGLWLHAALTRLGWSALVLERDRVGGGQTLFAQGILHSGAKYGLGAAPPPPAYRRALALWEEALSGQGLVPLDDVPVARGARWMWPVDQAGRARLQQLAQLDPLLSRAERPYPPALRRAEGLYRLAEPSLDVGALIRTLAHRAVPRLVHLDPLDAAWQLGEGGRCRLTWRAPALRVDARRLILCGGAGNAALSERLTGGPRTQRRPLHMVMLRASSLPALSLHVVDAGDGPVLTLTTHLDGDGERVWYLGGGLAERGVARSPAAQIAEARRLLGALFPDLDLGGARWETLRVDRAERWQADGRRPAGPDLVAHPQALVGWPTKLTLTPLLGKQVVEALAAEGLRPSAPLADEALRGLPQPPPGAPPWRRAG